MLLPVFVMASFGQDIADLLGYVPLGHDLVLPSYTRHVVVQVPYRRRSGYRYVCRPRSSLFVSAVNIVLQSDFTKLQR